MTVAWKRGGWWEDTVLQRTSPPYGPVNTWTNFVFPAFGVYAGVTHGAWLFALTMIWLGLGSGVYHAFKSSFAGAWDNSGMFAVLGCLVAGLAGAIFGAAFGMLQWKPGWFRTVNHRHVVGVVFAVVVLNTGWAAWQAVLAFAIAYALWTVDKARVDNDGNVLTTPWYAKYLHGVWHLVAGLGFYLLFLLQLAL